MHGALRRWALFGGLAVLTWHGQPRWTSEMAVWQQAVTVTPHRPRPLVNLGSTYDHAGQRWQANVAYKQALGESYDLRRGSQWRREVKATVEVNIAHVLMEQGYLASAMRELDITIADYPTFPYAHYNRGAVLRLYGACFEAMREYQLALILLRVEGRQVLPTPEPCHDTSN